MPPGKIILLHGPSSSGKSTLARALQSTIDAPFWHYSIDHIKDAGVLPSARIQSGEFNWSSLRPAFLSAFAHSVGVIMAEGNNLILEHILDQHVDVPQLRQTLVDQDLFFVGLHCPLDVLQAREIARGDRFKGSAKADFQTVHAGMTYDFTVDSTAPVAQSANQLIAAWHKRSGRSAFFDHPDKIP
ncbi:chloramphenicol phosphotransferase CPT family protein [Roseobacter sp. EG26]|uniref:chloramphenicol phosphotransferase CPT family protein n=1 Tax=Roseobacter sp. EG26 TaxID=3412477 RepID=UPI003CE54AFB